MKIRYNIAADKKVDYVRYYLTIFVLVVLSVVFTAVGSYSLSFTQKQFQNEKAKVRAYRDKKEKKDRDKENQKKEIDRIKTQWYKKISFSNSIIQVKLYPYLDRLNTLEELLPEGVFLTQVVLKSDAGPTIRFNVTALSVDKLMETYKTFIGYNLAISNESQVQATLEIKVQDEKK